MLQASRPTLDIRDGAVVDKASGRSACRSPSSGASSTSARHAAEGLPAELVVTRHYTPREYPFAFTNGIQASYVEVDPDTGFVKLLKHWCVEDCGTGDQPAAGGRADPRRHRAGHRRARCSRSASTTTTARC
jgi:aerobic carbon-monoxide dehydrogenase large subunit